MEANPVPLLCTYTGAPQFSRLLDAAAGTAGCWVRTHPGAAPRLLAGPGPSRNAAAGEAAHDGS